MKDAPTSGGDAASRWQAFVQRSSHPAAYDILSGSLRFGPANDTRRVTYLLWSSNTGGPSVLDDNGHEPAGLDAADRIPGATDDERTIRLEVNAGVGANVAKAVFENGQMLLVLPRDQKAYAGAETPETLRRLLGLPLPIGISFFTFQTMSYTIDVYRRDAPAQRDIVAFGAYVTMFPQLIAGPIVQYKTVAKELDHRVNTTEDFALGARRFTVGLAKKVLLANQIGGLWRQVGNIGYESVSTPLAWMGIAAYSLQLYLDFCGYSWMAIGVGEMLGFRLPRNFEHPYAARSMRDFWRRWHISLSSWFRDYVYIPLGGSREGKARTYLNLLAVWVLTGLWHGAAWNFVAWGLYFAAFLLLEKLFLGRWLKRVPVLGHVYVLLAALFSFVLFDAASVPAALETAGGLLGLGGLPLWDSGALYYLRSYAPVLALAAVGSTPLPAALCRRIAAGRAGRVLDALEPAALLALLAVCTAFLVSGSANPFLYFRF